MATTKLFNWTQSPAYSGYRAEMPNDVTLVVSPDRIKGFANQPARGTTWHAQASQWDEPTKCISLFGRDEYRD